ncbi:hypothetical protein EB796_018868 [Bugula neritina]|uniref:U3 small nucleolar RNA-associated protein 25 homolog n=1 Tax=Bugula neritina TaxID=10212 RepID=A0A7J7JAY1_BUGNE|nr:hypothetical protein EB796_018868 [Bugula neritina]
MLLLDVTDSEASTDNEEHGEENVNEVSNSESKPDPSRKRVLSDGEEVEELSLAESSSAEDSSEDVPQSKKLKPLDLAVYPDDVLPVEPVKPKVVVKETIKPDDSFSTHFEQELDETKLLSLADKKQWTAKRVEVVGLGRGMHRYPPTCDSTELNDPTATLPSVGLRSRLFNHVGKTLKQHCGVQQTGDAEPALSRAQRSMFDIINQYKDLYNPAVTNEHLEQFRMVYCLHSLNHILKTRLTVTNNSEEKRANELKKKAMDKEYRDQGLTRPKVLILTPFKECARRIVNMFESLLMSKKKSFISNQKRFLSEFSPEEDSGIDPKKPDDYVKLFDGNTDDCFRLGVQLSKSGMKLYVDFYKADILLCSPLGLRLILGADGDLKRDYDFMSSIEVLILDQADVFLMQNWEHLLHTMRLLHVQPKESRGTDYSRVRMWTLDGHAKHYRQTIVQSCVHCPEVAAIFTKHCANKSGEVKLEPATSTGSICHIVSQMPLLFQRFPSSSPGTLPDDRFSYFIKEVLPRYTGKEKAGTLIYVPAYYDYVRLRNYFHKEKLETSLVCEYSSEKAVKRAKKKFFTKETHFMLYTERIHFFRRMHLKKIRQLVFYSLPTYPQFFSEICNMYKTSQLTDASCLVLFSNSEAHKLSMCIGHERTKHILTSTKKNLFMFVTGEE